jgi:hypothetical protein
MSRLIRFAILFLNIALINACQSYTSGLQQSVVRADETAALALIRTISIAERTYNLTHEGEYGTLQQLVDAGFLDARFAGEKPLKDYVISLNVIPKAAGSAAGSYSCNVDPDKTGEHVGRHLYVDSSTDGIHVNDTKPASATDKLIQ